MARRASLRDPTIRKAHIVLAHPEPQSFNGQMKDLACEELRSRGVEVSISDLYEMAFDPVESPKYFSSRQDPKRFRPQAEQRHAFDIGDVSPDVQAEIDKISSCDLLILQYPMWWYGMPAILKGWVDRVFTYGGVYTSRIRYNKGRFRGKRALLSITTGGPGETFQPNGRNADIEMLVWPSCFTMYYVGFSVLRPFVSFGVEGGLRYSGLEVMVARLNQYQAEYRRRLITIDQDQPMGFNGWEDWDESGRLRPGVKTYSQFMRHPDPAAIGVAASSDRRRIPD